MIQSVPVTITEQTVFCNLENVGGTEHASEQIESVKTAAHLGMLVSCAKTNALTHVQGTGVVHQPHCSIETGVQLGTRAFFGLE